MKSSSSPQERHVGGSGVDRTIPDDLLTRPHWIAWKYESRPGQDKPAKPPIDPETGTKARSDDPDTWSSFGRTIARYKRSDDLDGLGFVLTDEDPILGIDLDDVRDPETEDIAPEARLIMLALDSYVEISPSGTGLHVLVLAEDDLPEHWRTRASLDRPGPLDDHPGIEVYESGQYLSVTADVLPGYETIDEGSEALSAIGEKYLADDQGSVSDENNEHTLSPFDEETGPDSTTSGSMNTDVDPDPHRIRRTLEEYEAVGNEYARRALDLWESSESDSMGHPSPSEADLEFAWRLSFWARNDRRLVERCIRSSRRYREKWDRDTYGKATIETAVGNNHDIFRGRFVRG